MWKGVVAWSPFKSSIDLSLHVRFCTHDLYGGKVYFELYAI